MWKLFNKSALDQQRTRVAQSEENFSGFLRSVMLASLVCGLIVAFASIFRVSQLEDAASISTAGRWPLKIKCVSYPSSLCVRRKRNGGRFLENYTMRSGRC